MKKVWLVVCLGALCCACVSRSPSKTALDYYDACEVTDRKFVAMAECGKRTRNASCGATNECSPMGNAIVGYADALADQVRANTLSEAEARRKWIEFKVARMEEMRRDGLSRAAIEAASAPRTCHTFGTTTNCF